MLNQVDILREMDAFDRFGIDRSGYGIVYGAAMCIHGLKSETSDIDIACNEDIYNKLLSLGFLPEDYRNGKRIKVTKTIDFFFGGTELEPEYEEINGFNVQTISSLRAEKATRGREKDLKDVELIDAFLRKFQ